jgi:hypothetical protein
MATTDSAPVTVRARRHGAPSHEVQVSRPLPWVLRRCRTAARSDPAMSYLVTHGVESYVVTACGISRA